MANTIQIRDEQGNALYPITDSSLVIGLPAEVTANPTVPPGTTATTLTGLKVGSDYYSVPSGGGGTVGTLNTTATTAQSTNASESLSGSLTLHKIAKTGTYSDLIGAPTIPTVNNSTITIQMNSSTVDTFTTNAASAKTINLGTVITSETDPVFTASAAHGISASDITAWNAKQKAITVSSSEPTSSQGSNGDIWIVI